MALELVAAELKKDGKFKVGGGLNKKLKQTRATPAARMSHPSWCHVVVTSQLPLPRATTRLVRFRARPVSTLV
jgi:hypothetical protein